MGSQAFELAILISLRDAASSGADRVSDRLRSMGKEGKQALKTFEDLRKDLHKGLVIGGIGVAGLAAMKGGIRTAGDFEAALTELRLSIEQVGNDGKVNLAKLGDEMNRFESLGVKLGNQLPGTTQDFIEMFSVLKKGGLDTETILKGAGEQVAYLSVLTNTLPKDLAGDFAKLGLQFQLKPEDFAPSTDKFLKMYRAVGLHPSQLIEGTKFAELRAGLPLGLKGMKGLDTMSTLLASLASVGLEGGVGGRELGGLMLSLVPHGREQVKADAMLRKKGIKLDYFDKKGDFVGEKGLIEQLAQLKKINPEEKQTILKQRFNEAALGPISALSERGIEGYELLQKKMAAVPPIQVQINEKMASFNAKLESLEGTLDNLKATSFTSLLDTLKPVVDTLNTGVGSLQEFLKAHQTTASVAAHMFGVGSATLIAVGGVKSLTAAWRLWKIASAVGNEQKLIEFLGRVRTEANKTASGVESASARTTKAADGMGRSFGMKFMRGVGAGLIGIELSRLIVQKFRDDLDKAEQGLIETQAGGYESYKKLPDELKKQFAPGEAQSALAAINRNDMLKRALSGGGGFDALSSITRNIPLVGAPLTDQKYDRFGKSFDVSKAAEEIKKVAPGLQDPDIMKHAIRRTQGGAMGLDRSQRPDALKALEAAWPESFRKASEMIQAEGKTNLTEMAALASKFDGPTNQSVDALNKLTKAAGMLRRLATMQRESLRERRLRLGSWLIPGVSRKAQTESRKLR